MKFWKKEREPEYRSDFPLPRWALLKQVELNYHSRLLGGWQIMQSHGMDLLLDPRLQKRAKRDRWVCIHSWWIRAAGVVIAVAGLFLAVRAITVWTAADLRVFAVGLVLALLGSVLLNIPDEAKRRMRERSHAFGLREKAIVPDFVHEGSLVAEVFGLEFNKPAKLSTEALSFLINEVNFQVDLNPHERPDQLIRAVVIARREGVELSAKVERRLRLAMDTLREELKQQEDSTWSYLDSAQELLEGQKEE